MNIKQSNYEIGDIVFVSKYEYSDGTSGDNHLFVIVDKEKNGLVPIEYFGLIVSSNIKKKGYKYNEFLPRDKLNGLNYNSIVKCDILYSILPKYILFKIGSIDIDDYIRFINSYSNANNINVA